MPATGNRSVRAKHKGKRKRYVAVMKRHKKHPSSPEYREAQAKVRALDLPPAPRSAGAART